MFPKAYAYIWERVRDRMNRDTNNFELQMQTNPDYNQVCSISLGDLMDLDPLTDLYRDQIQIWSQILTHSDEINQSMSGLYQKYQNGLKDIEKRLK